jgi:plasmid maintenance system killer protein
MDITTGDNKLRKAIEDERVARRQYGLDMAEKLKLRVAGLRAAESLADFWPPRSGPERCHELKGDSEGIFSVDLKQPYRLLFRPHDEASLPDRSDELKRWRAVTGIEIFAIEDTHG